MKQIASILLAITILFLNIGFSITNHYCEGELKKTALTLGDKDLECGMMSESLTNAGEMIGMVDCGMDAMISCEAPVENVAGINNDCCENEYLSLKIDDIYEKQNVENLKVNYKFIVAYIVSYINLFSTNNLKSKEYLTYSPPLLEQDVHILNQSFLL
jgi:hypothetical protein